MKKILLISLLVSLTSFSQTEISILSWNIRDFGKTKTATTISKIASIVKDYDIVAIQEVVSGYGGSQAVARLADELNRKGSKWDYAISNPTQSPPYKTERYAFLWKPSKVRAIGRGRLLSELETVVYREPFLMKFKIRNKTVTIYNYHSRKYNDHPEIEVKELIKHIVKQSDPIILAGDFNLKENEEVFTSFYYNGFITAIINKKTTLKQKCKNSNYKNHPIDNIFIPTKFFSIQNSRVLDYIKNCANLTEARKISDHLPVVTTISFK